MRFIVVAIRRHGDWIRTVHSDIYEDKNLTVDKLLEVTNMLCEYETWDSKPKETSVFPYRYVDGKYVVDCNTENIYAPTPTNS